VLPILYESPSLLVVDKPSGLVVIPGRYEEASESLWRVLERDRGERLWVCHRIDRDTTGVVVFARTAAAHRSVSVAFERGLVRKRYLALVSGTLPADEGLIDTPLHPARRGKMRPATPAEEGALVAETHYGVLQRFALGDRELALVAIRPRTGRQHQIRVHLRSVGAPLAVDPLYGRASRLDPLPVAEGHTTPALERLTLHAAGLELACPSTGAPLTFEAPTPPDLAAWIAAAAPAELRARLG
jgi:tRNA pseudouridine32 synthase/23S rRNA pseudouridine746 synthase